jgi:protein-S-isoprenylcysteine O-methyltransferase Ste14
MKNILLPPVIWVASAALMLLLHLTVPVIQLVPAPWTWLGLTLLVAGLAMARWHAVLFRRVGTNINTFGQPDKLTTEGLFRRTRNPMYLGMIVSLLGLAWVLGSLSPLASPLGFFVLAHGWYVPLEEKNMSLKFGEAYATYQRSVPRWL